MGKLLKILTPLKKEIVIMFVLLVLQVFGTLYIPTLTADIVNNGIVKGDVDYIWRTGAIMVGVAVVTALISLSVTYLSSYLAASLGKLVRNILFQKSQVFTINEFNKFGAASMITRSTSDIIQVQQTFSALIEMLLPAPVMIIVGLVLAFSKSPAMGVMIIMTMLVVTIGTFFIEKKAVPIMQRLQVLLDKINKVMRENITGIRVIRAFNRSDDEQKKEKTVFVQYADNAIKINKIYALMLPGILITLNLCTVLIIWFGGKNVAAGSMETGDIMAVIEYAMMILMYLVMAVMAYMMLPRAEISAQRINEVLDHPLSSAARSEHQQMDTQLISSSAPKLEFQNVYFGYDGAEKPVLEKISFKVSIGETLAIIGSTGSGKSTIANLIPRLYDIKSGRILIDGEDANRLSEYELRQRIGYIPQKAFLFSGTIADNLRHGKKEATLEEMREAARIAQAGDFIENLPDGYDSPVAQAGNNFSGGQKQRLAIARAIIKKPEIYVFDDSFSALDFKTDANLRRALKEETKNAAIILIAQRISTIMDADQILVLDQGQIVGIGKHRELLESCSVYRQIAETQLTKEELA